MSSNDTQLLLGHLTTGAFADSQRKWAK